MWCHDLDLTHAPHPTPYFLILVPVPTMHCTNNIWVWNAHSSHSAWHIQLPCLPIQLPCPQCDHTFLSTWGHKQHIHALHPQPTSDTNHGEESLNHQPIPSPLSSSNHSSRLTSDIEMLSSINHSSPSGNSPSGSVNMSSSSSSSVHAEQEHQDTPSTPSTQKCCITVEDVTDEDDNNVSPQRSPSSDYSFIYSWSSSGSGHTEQGHQDTPSTPSTPKHHITVEDVTNKDDNNASPWRSPGSHYSYSHFEIGSDSFFPHSNQRHEAQCSESKIRQNYYLHLTGKFIFILSLDLAWKWSRSALW